MKNRLVLIGIFFTLISCLIIFSGCAEKKVTVKSELPNMQEPAPALIPPPATETAKQPSTTETANTKEAADEQSSLMGATAKSPVSDINFDFDSSIIRPDAREILKANADFLLKNKAATIVIEGHCDEKGTAEYNMALGQRRAQETKNYLVNVGINESIIRTISYGKERPLDPASNEEAWAKNRRAHFVVTR
jgi:peptidoglycan-associated lipoprotein